MEHRFWPLPLWTIARESPPSHTYFYYPFVRPNTPRGEAHPVPIRLNGASNVSKVAIRGRTDVERVMP
jgi:hypothetical protein